VLQTRPGGGIAATSDGIGACCGPEPATRCPAPTQPRVKQDRGCVGAELPRRRHLTAARPVATQPNPSPPHEIPLYMARRRPGGAKCVHARICSRALFARTLRRRIGTGTSCRAEAAGLNRHREAGAVTADDRREELFCRQSRWPSRAQHVVAWGGDGARGLGAARPQATSEFVRNAGLAEPPRRWRGAREAGCSPVTPP